MAGMSKTPEEIKIGLECCEKYLNGAPEEECCHVCNYANNCAELKLDALALIRQLERDKNWASENYDLIREENKRLEAHILCKIDVIKRLETQNSELLEKIKQLERERDAAVRDCARFPCYTCNERENGEFCPQCRTTGTFRALHEWRGPCEENEEITK